MIEIDAVEWILRQTVELLQKGEYAPAAVFAFMLLVAILKKYGGNFFPFLKTDIGGTILMALFAPASAVGTLVLTGTPLTGPLILGTFISSAIGGTLWQIWRRLILRLLVPVFSFLSQKVPFLGPVVRALLEKFAGKYLDEARDYVLRKFTKPVGTIAVAVREMAVKSTTSATEAEQTLAYVPYEHLSPVEQKHIDSLRENDGGG